MLGKLKYLRIVECLKKIELLIMVSFPNGKGTLTE